MAARQADVRAAQRLRHRVFAGEMGAALHTPEPGLDIDHYDAYCDHLVVREDSTGEIVGTYRMLSPDGAHHTSWLDLLALGAVQPLRMVAKSEVRGWPVIGLLARRVERCSWIASGC